MSCRNNTKQIFLLWVKEHTHNPLDDHFRRDIRYHVVITQKGYSSLWFLIFFGNSNSVGSHPAHRPMRKGGGVNTWVIRSMIQSHIHMTSFIIQSWLKWRMAIWDTDVCIRHTKTTIRFSYRQPYVSHIHNYMSHIWTTTCHTYRQLHVTHMSWHIDDCMSLIWTITCHTHGQLHVTHMSWRIDNSGRDLKSYTRRQDKHLPAQTHTWSGARRQNKHLTAQTLTCTNTYLPAQTHTWSNTLDDKVFFKKRNALFVQFRHDIRVEGK